MVLDVHYTPPRCLTHMPAIFFGINNLWKWNTNHCTNMCLQKGWKTRGSTPTPTASTSYFVWYVCVIIRYVNSVGCGTSEQVLKTFRRNTQASWGSISQQQHRILLHNLRCDAQQCKEFNLSLALRYNKRHWFRQCQWEIPLRWRRLAIRHTAPSTNKYSKKKKKIESKRMWTAIEVA